MHGVHVQMYRQSKESSDLRVWLILILGRNLGGKHYDYVVCVVYSFVPYFLHLMNSTCSRLTICHYIKCLP